LLAVPRVVPGQELPKVTPDGMKAAAQLLEAGKKAGAIKAVKDRRTQTGLFVVADETKLRELVDQQKTQFTPAVRDALLIYWNHPAIAALLLHLGKQTGDDRAVAFGNLFLADWLREESKLREARQ